MAELDDSIPRRPVVARTDDELVEAIKQADAAGVPVRLVEAGAVPPPDFDGQVIQHATTGLMVNDDACDVDGLVYCGALTVTVAAGEVWDEFVAKAVAQEWVGVEALAGQPGTVGSAVAANVHAFGQSVADTVASIHTWDREAGARRYLAAVDCEFGPDGSRLSRHRLRDGSPRYVPLKVSFLMKQGERTAPIHHEDLAALLGVEPGTRAALAQVRDRVLETSR